MKSDSCNRDECDISAVGKICDMLDDAGVPHDNRWRTLLIYLRGLRDFDYLNTSQKSRLHSLLTDILVSRDYSEERLDAALQQEHDIIVEPYVQRLNAALHEASELVREFKTILATRRGDVQQLEGQSIEAVESGMDSKDVVQMLRSAFAEVVDVLDDDAQNINKMTLTDPLTNAGNRRAFDTALAADIKKWQKEGVPVGLMMLDVDHFKKFNDSYGHRIGDQALITVVRIMRESIDTVFSSSSRVSSTRYGGEEFAVICSGDDLLQMEALAEEIRSRMERYNFIIRDSSGNVLYKGITITLSIGLAEVEEEWDGHIEAKLIDAADSALYYAKNSGRNRVVRIDDGNYTIISHG